MNTIIHYTLPMYSRVYSLLQVNKTPSIMTTPITSDLATFSYKYLHNLCNISVALERGQRRAIDELWERQPATSGRFNI